MLHAGLDLSRRRLDVCLLDDAGELVAQTAAAPDADGLRHLVERLKGQRVRAVIESMNGARFVHDTLEEHGWEVLIADAQKVKGLAPLACKTDRIDAQVLALLSQRDLVPAIWLPDPSIRRERELARYRLHLVRHRTTLKNRIHATLITFGHPCPVSDLFGFAGRQLLDRLAIPDPWRRNVDASLELIDDLELQIAFDAFLLEYDDARSGSFEPLAGAPDDKEIVLGLVSTKKPELESPAVLQARIEEAGRFFPRDQMALSTQCGFASIVTGNPISEEVEEHKLRLVADVAHAVWN